MRAGEPDDTTQAAARIEMSFSTPHHVRPERFWQTGRIPGKTSVLAPGSTLAFASASVSTSVSVLVFAFACTFAFATAANAQSFVEYPGHPATYGDHTINATWTGGPTSVVLTFESDESILHGDGIGQSQRTARNTLTHTPPSDPGNPQDYDALAVISVYGERLPLLQQMSANGTSTLRFDFGEPVATGFDLFVTDVDTADHLVLRAFGPGDMPIDMTTWNLIAEGDLSLYKNTGSGYSDIVAPSPFVHFLPEGVEVDATDGTNYNRSYSIFRAPIGADVAHFELEFTGIQNSANRDQGGTGSHVYVGLSTLPETSGVETSNDPGDGAGAPTDQTEGDATNGPKQGPANGRDGDKAQQLGFALISANPSGAEALRFSVRLVQPTEVEIGLFDSSGRRVSASITSSLGGGTHEVRFLPPKGLVSGAYLARLRTSEGSTASATWVFRR